MTAERKGEGVENRECGCTRETLCTYHRCSDPVEAAFYEQAFMHQTHLDCFRAAWEQATERAAKVVTDELRTDMGQHIAARIRGSK